MAGFPRFADAFFPFFLAFGFMGPKTILTVKPTITTRTIHAGLHPGDEIGAAVTGKATCITVLALTAMMRTILGAVAMVAVAAIITSVKKGWDAG